MIEKTLYAIVIALALFVFGALLLPRQVHIERSIDINRPVATVFAVVNSFESFPDWSPLAARDPSAVFELSGPPEGVGARLDWNGDARLVGTGWQEITGSTRGSRVDMHLELEQLGAAESYFQIDKLAGGARLTWGFDADLVEGQGMFGGLLARYFGLLFDRWIGGDYEEGLEHLRQYVETLPATDFGGLEVELLDVSPMEILFVSGLSGGMSSNIEAFLAAAFREISAFMAENGLEMTAQPMAITRAWDEQGLRFDAAIPVAANIVQPTGRVRQGVSPSGRAVRLVHRGAYEEMPASYEKLAAFMAVHGLNEGRVSWEQYISDPGETPRDELITHIYFLVDDSTGATVQ